MAFAEITFFIKYTVVWQVLFVVNTQYLSIFHYGCRVVAVTLFTLIDKTKNHHNVFDLAELLKCFLRAFCQARTE
ncbi:hypothetical protein SDC9_160461 [bioreactor metagenome]|uniref:Uncharacterized protein n=1 Tax=bioreactor metagenome TaxID=1076179 RepID=A0A645FFJ6_9ZZZZ